MTIHKVDAIGRLTPLATSTSKTASVTRAFARVLEEDPPTHTQIMVAEAKLQAAFAATQERPNDLALAREYLALVREHNVRVSADVCRVGALAVARQKELAADERTCAEQISLSECVCTFATP